MKKRLSFIICALLVISLLLTSCEGFFDYLPPAIDGTNQNGQQNGNQNGEENGEENGGEQNGAENTPLITLENIPVFDGSTPYAVINGNIPFFADEDTSKSYEFYSELDSLGRCGVAISCIGKELLPTEDRGSIGQVKPTGWHTVKYDIVDGKYLYNRCHLIGYQLTAENANTKNLITGTRYMNVTGMLPFENMVADYLEEYPENHVLYRVTPIFEGANLVASGVLMEAKSVEDNGEDILFCVYVYNAQPGITIDYATGKSHLSTEQPPENDDEENKEETELPEMSDVQTFVLNTKTHKFHKESCTHAKSMSESSKSIFTGSREELIIEGYEPCGTCKP